MAPMRSWKILPILALTVLGLVGFAVRGIPFTQNEGETGQGNVESRDRVRPEDHRSVTCLGRLEPSGEVVEVSAASERRIDSIAANEGDWVEQGQELFRLDTYDELHADFELAQVKYEAAKRRLDMERKLAKTRVDVATTKLERVDKLNPLEIEAQQAQVRLFEQQWLNEKRDLDRKLELGSSVSKQVLDDQKSAVAEAEEQKKAAESDLAAMRSKESLDRLQAEAELEQYRAEADLVEILYSTLTAEKQMNLTQIRRDRASIKAPRSGEILAVLVHRGEKIGTRPVLQLGNTRQMVAVAEVYETEITLVEIGQQAWITNPALKEPVKGEVIQIAHQVFKNDLLGVDPTRDIDARVIEVHIRLETTEEVAKLTNLEVDIEILTRPSSK